MTVGVWNRVLARSKAITTTIMRRRGIALVIVVVMLPLTLMATQAQGVYYSRADVLFLVPSALVGGNSLQADPAQTLSFAAVVEHRLNAERPSAAPRSTSAPLYGTGVRNTHAVYIPNSGGQWQLSFSRPVITVEVVSDSAETAASVLDQLVDRISELAAESQVQKGIRPAARITTELSPGLPYVTHISVRNDRAAASLILLTLGLAGGIPLVVERLTLASRNPARSTQLV